MANEKNRALYKSETVELVDGTEITLKSLPIKPLREFMKIWEAIDYEKAESEMEVFDEMFKASAVAILWFNDHVDEEKLEETLDQETMRRAITVCAGIKLMDQDELENLIAAQATQ